MELMKIKLSIKLYKVSWLFFHFYFVSVALADFKAEYKFFPIRCYLEEQTMQYLFNSNLIHQTKDFNFCGFFNCRLFLQLRPIIFTAIFAASKASEIMLELNLLPQRPSLQPLRMVAAKQDGSSYAHLNYTSRCKPVKLDGLLNELHKSALSASFISIF